MLATDARSPSQSLEEGRSRGVDETGHHHESLRAELLRNGKVDVCTAGDVIGIHPLCVPMRACATRIEQDRRNAGLGE